MAHPVVANHLHHAGRGLFTLVQIRNEESADAVFYALFYLSASSVVIYRVWVYTEVEGCLKPVERDVLLCFLFGQYLEYRLAYCNEVIYLIHIRKVLNYLVVLFQF